MTLGTHNLWIVLGIRILGDSPLYMVRPLLPPFGFGHGNPSPRSSTMGAGKLSRIGLEVAHVSGRHGSSNGCRGHVPRRRKRFRPGTSQRSPVRPQGHSPIQWHPWPQWQRATRLIGVDEAQRELQPGPLHPRARQPQMLEPRPKARLLRLGHPNRRHRSPSSYLHRDHHRNRSPGGTT